MCIKTSTLLLFFLTFLHTRAHNWGLVWSDEFNGSSIDAGHWKFETGASGWGNNGIH